MDAWRRAHLRRRCPPHSRQNCRLELFRVFAVCLGSALARKKANRWRTCCETAKMQNRTRNNLHGPNWRGLSTRPASARRVCQQEVGPQRVLRILKHANKTHLVLSVYAQANGQENCQKKMSFRPVHRAWTAQSTQPDLEWQSQTVRPIGPRK